MKADWVPAWGYGDILSVSAGTRLDHPLMDPQRYGSNTAWTEGVIEDDSGRFFVERIVGQYTMWYDDVVTIPVAMERIWPVLYEADGTITVPGLLTSVNAANSRFWYDKVSFCLQQQSWEDNDALVSHPFWRHVDIRPKQVCEQNIAPAWSITNLEPTTPLRVTHRFRLLLKPLR